MTESAPPRVAIALKMADQPARRNREFLFMLHLTCGFQNDTSQPNGPDKKEYPAQAAYLSKIEKPICFTLRIYYPEYSKHVQ